MNLFLSFSFLLFFYFSFLLSLPHIFPWPNIAWLQIFECTMNGQMEHVRWRTSSVSANGCAQDHKLWTHLNHTSSQPFSSDLHFSTPWIMYGMWVIPSKITAYHTRISNSKFFQKICIHLLWMADRYLLLVWQLFFKTVF